MVGGSGRYSFHLPLETTGKEEDGPFTATVHGIVVAGRTGSGTLLARDAANALNENSTRVVIAPPRKLEFLPSVVEIAVGETLPLFVTARPDDPDAHRYYRCGQGQTPLARHGVPASPLPFFVLQVSHGDHQSRCVVTLAL